MRTKVVAMMGMLVMGWSVIVPGPVSAGWLTGGTFTVTVNDSPLGDNFNQGVTLAPGTTTLETGMTLTQTIIPVNASSQWLVLDFEATNGGLLAGNPTGAWQIQAGGIPTTPAYLTGVFFDFTVNEVPTNPISTFPGFFSPIETNPINPALGDVYGSFTPPSGPPFTGWYAFAAWAPYNGISAGGMDTNAVNGFTLALLEVDAVPEPSSLCLVAIGAVVLGGFRLARGKVGSSGGQFLSEEN
jgi:hypothetical protein